MQNPEFKSNPIFFVKNLFLILFLSSLIAPPGAYAQLTMPVALAPVRALTAENQTFDQYAVSATILPVVAKYQRYTPAAVMSVKKVAMKNLNFAPFTTPVAVVQDTFPLDSTQPRKRFWRASWELMVAQVLPWSYNYFIRDAEFAHVTWESIWYNMQFKNWEWDDNNFKTNQFAHPFHGNLYFNAFRTNGYNFWQSAPASLVGSYMWEVAGETHPASPNDLINTTLGGIALGEMTYRAANLIVDNRKTGFGRQVQEVCALIVNPMNGFNRILDGKWGRVAPNHFTRSPLKLGGTLDIGWRRFSTKVEDVLDKGDNEFYARMKFNYGDPFSEYSKPFDNFYLGFEIGASDSAYLNALYVNGTLAGWPMREDEKVTHLATVTMNYDYYLNTAFEYGGQSFHFNILSDFHVSNKTNIQTNAGVGPIVIAAVPSEYLYFGEGRDYNFGMGVGFRGGAMLMLSNRFSFNIHYRGGWFKTVNGLESSYFINAPGVEASYLVYKGFSFGLEVGYFDLEGDYADYEDTDNRYPFGRVSFGYKLGN